MIQFQTDRRFAQKMDQADPLGSYRERFHIPKGNAGDEAIYFCGNSLGLQPKNARAYLEEEMEAWEKLGVEGHSIAKTSWISYHEKLNEQTSAIVGAEPDEVAVMNSLTVNLHLMLVSFYKPVKTRHKVLMEAKAFPSDQYAVKSQIEFHGYDPTDSLVVIHPREGESTIRTEDLESLLHQEGKEIALVLIGGVNYYNGQAFTMERIVRAAHDAGCIVGFDLAHAIGNIPLRLHDWGVDFAIWCSYKYLNGGPGSTAGIFVHSRYASNNKALRFAGWWGNNESTRFNMESGFDPIRGAGGWQVSNPAILSMAALRASMDIFAEIGMDALRYKSVRLTSYLDFLLNKTKSSAFSIITPRNSDERGAQLSLRIPEGGKEVFERLRAAGVVCDWREPDVIRVAPVPLYNTFVEVFRFAEIFRSAIGKEG